MQILQFSLFFYLIVYEFSYTCTCLVIYDYFVDVFWGRMAQYVCIRYKQLQSKCLQCFQRNISLVIPPAFMPTGIKFSLFRSYVRSLVRFFVRNSGTFVEFMSKFWLKFL